MRKAIALLAVTGLLAGCSSEAALESEEQIAQPGDSSTDNSKEGPSPESAKEDSGSAIESEEQATKSDEPSEQTDEGDTGTDPAAENADSMRGDFDIEAALENVANLLESAQDSGIAECTGNTFPAEASDVGFGTKAFTSCQTDFGLLVINEYPSDSHAAAASDNYIDNIAGLDYSESVNLAVMNDERTYIYVWGSGSAQLDVPALANHLGFDYEQILTGSLD